MKTPVLIVALVACSKPAEPTRPDFSSWDMPAKQVAWQGAFVIDDGREAMAISGDQVTNWDGSHEFTFTLELVSPCGGWLVEGSKKTGVTYTVVAGTLRYTGLGGGGYRRGREAIVCREGVYLLDAAGTCTYWQERSGAWSKTPAKCGFRPDVAGNEVFFVVHDGINEKLMIEGDSLVPAGLVTHKVADYAAAKAAVAVKRKPQ